jgi:shikimate dehydrogenase
MTTRNAFVVGWPVAHSRSPLIHRFWLKRYSIDGDYRAEAVPPDAIDGFLSSLGDRGYCGGNVTLPYKEAAFRACRSLTPVARRLEAVNTLWLEGSALHGDNTDAFGFVANLDDNVNDWRGGANALVLGAGGASRAVVHALIEAGYGSIDLLNRTPARAAALAGHLGDGVRPGGLDAIPQRLPNADIIVNATPAGLGGDAALRIDWSLARSGAIATDLVYVPLVTPFLSAAAESGLRIVDGLGMLLHQAVPGFEHWFGVRPEIDAELRELVIDDLRG